MFDMLVKERTNLNFGYNFINPSTVGEKLAHINSRPFKKEICDSKTSICPNCDQDTRLTRTYNRVIDFLAETVEYQVVYYYCDSCKLGWPSIPVDCLPNISIGIDVIGHIAKWHVLYGQSFETISQHLNECHAIIRSANSIKTCFYRFEIFCLKAQTLFISVIQEFLQTQEVKFGIFDEAFYNSLYNDKLCLGIMFLPETRVIAGIQVTKDHNQDTIRQIMSDFKQKISDLDILGVDLAPMYTNPISEVFTAVSLQYCVFHFFQILYRNIVRPFAIEVKQLVKEDLEKLRSRIKERFKQLRKSIPGKYIKLLEDLEKRFNYCLKKRNPNYLVIEFEIFVTELFNSITEAKKKSDYSFSIDSNEHLLILGLEGIINISKILLAKLKRNTHLIQFQELFNFMSEIKILFQQTEEDSFNVQYQKIEQMTENSSNQHIFDVLKYLKKYQSNLTLYLSAGVDKTTSLLEQVNQRMKKNTKNNRGAHYETTLQSYANIYQFFWNTEPLQLENELKKSKKSPIGRLSVSTENSDIVDLNGEWWSWLQPIPYHEYRKQVIIAKKRRKSESQLLVNKRQKFKDKNSSDYSIKAKNRWKNSKTLVKLKDFVNIKKIEDIPTLLDKNCLKSLSQFDKDLYNFLLKFSDGVNRSFLKEFFKLPRSTIYDSLTRLGVRKLVVRKKIRLKKRGQPSIHFVAQPIPNG